MPAGPSVRTNSGLILFGVWACLFPSACSGGGSDKGSSEGDGSASGSSGGGLASSGSSGGADDSMAPPPANSDDGGASQSDGGGGGGGGTDARFNADAGLPAGWLYTSGSKVYESNGNGGGTPWMGRGVNVDDIFMCGYNDSLWMTSAGPTLETELSTLFGSWKATFIRVSLAMDSYGTSVSWLSDPSQYKTPMVNVIGAIGSRAGVHVLVTLRSDASMIGQDTADGDPEGTGLPSDSTTTPDATKYPTGTDATYVAIVDAFANDGYVLFGLTNEPGGDKLSDATIAAAMSHAVGTIRAEEDRLGVPHHVVSVQGNGWTSQIGFYSTTPLPYDNVVYEVHGYPAPASSYTYSNIPVILGEYGSLTSSTSAAFYADIEGKQIPNLAWDFDSFNNCSPDLVNVDESATNITSTAWGSIVQAYLMAP
jgi:hypothetical protein